MTTTTDEMMALLATKAEEATASLQAALDEYTALRTKVQESAWALGWQNSIGPVMEDMLAEIGLEGRPERVAASVKCRLTVTVPNGVDLRSEGTSPLLRGAPMQVTQERVMQMGPIYLPRGTDSDNGCYCAAIDEHADPEQVRHAIREYNGWTDVSERFDFEVLAIRCRGYDCRNVQRTA